MISFFAEFFEFLKKRKLWWLAPIIIVLAGLAVFIWVFSASSPVAPFIYTIF
ncbi:MAG: DUF5989 family protein [bacterium]